jgi:CheY-like chemotaxis protein
MQTILIVDDEVRFTRSLSEGLSTMELGWTVLTARHGEAALEQLRAHPVDLLITDLKMPVMDGFQLLAHLARHYPDLPVMVMSAFVTPEIEERLRASGIDQFLEKPLDLFMFHGRVRKVLEASARGFIQGISLPTFLQMIELERKTCTITVRSGSQAGTLLFRNGVLIDAQAPGLQGHQAVLQLLSLTGTEIEIRNTCRAGRRVIQDSLQHLLLESMVCRDEQSDADAGAGSAMPPARVGSVPGPVPWSRLEPLAALDGFLGMALLAGDGTLLRAWPEARSGELSKAAGWGRRIAETAAAACAQLDLGRSALVHCDGSEGQAFILDLAGDGRAGFLYLAMTLDGQLGLARMKLLALAG